CSFKYSIYSDFKSSICSERLFSVICNLRSISTIFSFVDFRSFCRDFRHSFSFFHLCRIMVCCSSVCCLFVFNVSFFFSYCFILYVFYSFPTFLYSSQNVAFFPRERVFYPLNAPAPV